MRTEYGRRRFLGRALTLCASLMWVRRVPAADIPSIVGAGPKLVRILRDRASAATVGRRCIPLFPGATVDSHLAALARDVPELVAALEARRVSAARRIVAARTRWDFDHDRVVDVDGWVLSSTEARVYALAALLEEGA